MDKSLLFIYAVGTLAVVVAGVAGTLASLRLGVRVPRVLPYIALAGSAYLLAAQLLKLYAHKDYVDFTVSLEVVANIARGRGPWSSLQAGVIPGTGNWLSSHFTPLSYVFAVLFRLVPRVETLLVAQFLALSTALLAIYLYARRRLRSHEQALMIAAVLALYPTYQYIQLYEFETLRFCIPLLMFAFFGLESERLWVYWVFAGLALLAREDVALAVFLLGIYIAVYKGNRRWTGLLTSAIAAAYFLVVMLVIMPRLRTGGAHYVAEYWFADFGNTLPQVALGVFTKPGALLHAIFQYVKLANVFMYMLPVLFIPFAAWPVLLIGAGNVGVDMLSQSISHTSYFLYYQAPAIAFIFVALVQGVGRLGSALDTRWSRPRARGAGVTAVLVGVLAAAFAANLFFGPSPASLQFWFLGYRLAPFRTLNFHYTQYVVTPHDRLAATVLNVVPVNASVSAEQALLPLLYNRGALKVFPDIRGVQFVAIDTKDPIKTGISTVPGSWDGLREHPQYYYNWVEGDPAHWRLVVSRDGYMVYRRVGSGR